MSRSIDLPDEQASALERYCESEHVSPQAALARAVDALVPKPKARSRTKGATAATATQRPTRARLDGIDSAFGAWKNRGISTDEYPEPEEGETIDSKLEAAMSAAFGIWRDRQVDAVAYVRQLRAEWDRPWDPD